MFNKISSAFSAGAFGGLINGLAVWLFGSAGITQALRVSLHPALTPHFLYPRIVWGGIWGALFLLPIMKKSTIARGILYSLGPTLVMLFVFFPRMGKGTYGLELGMLTPLFVFIFNALWGIFAAIWYRVSAE